MNKILRNNYIISERIIQKGIIFWLILKTKFSISKSRASEPKPLSSNVFQQVHLNKNIYFSKRLKVNFERAMRLQCWNSLRRDHTDLFKLFWFAIFLVFLFKNKRKFRLSFTEFRQHYFISICRLKDSWQWLGRRK